MYNRFMKKILYPLVFLFALTIFTISGIIIGKNICNKSDKGNNNNNTEIDYENKEEKYEVIKRKGARDENTGECEENFNLQDSKYSLDNLPDFVKNNETAMKLLQNDCLFSMQNGYFDVTGDGNEEILLITEGFDCITCRATRLIIISEDEVLVDKSVSNAVIRKIKSNNTAFEIKEPIYFNSTGYCCPTKGIVKVYEYRGDKYVDFDNTPVFARVDEYTEEYQTNEYPTFTEREDIY